ncbi:MAG: hypothetical protein IJG34_07005 [Synergistaceae bacterium]|nr:hypothetical protein [Synergistaceae bacterium]MBQ3449626.1 hypothetical protein [Synergistaceae bacterium]MBQ3694834.1 hypothetical protein [Synergistaceae bacterium]MBQ9627675.1 hypothetical protein [Synergistaceae bacterium]MBR0070285.1 hypothetical protein [Synergistaceae bacterium]
MTNDPIHVALAVYDPSGTYSQHAGVTITSIFENTNSKVIIHLLHDDTLTEDNKKKFIRTAEKYSQMIELTDISGYKNRLKEITAKLNLRHWGIGAMYRLLIQDVIAADKVIYLDCDVLVNLDIKEMWNIDFEGKSLAAPHSVLYFRGCSPFSLRYYQIKMLGTDIQHYFSSGVLLMNLRKIRERGNFLNGLQEWITRNYYMDFFPDQDALNSIFAGDVKYIDAKFHVYKLNENLSGCIVHCFPSKAWKNVKGLSSEKLYWKMYLLSAWGENKTPFEAAEVILNVASTSSANVKKSLGRRILRKIYSLASRFIFTVSFFSQHAYYRLKYKLKASGHNRQP